MTYSHHLGVKLITFNSSFIGLLSGAITINELRDELTQESIDIRN